MLTNLIFIGFKPVYLLKDLNTRAITVTRWACLKHGHNNNINQFVVTNKDIEVKELPSFQIRSVILVAFCRQNRTE